MEIITQMIRFGVFSQSQHSEDSKSIEVDFILITFRVANVKL